MQGHMNTFASKSQLSSSAVHMAIQADMELSAGVLSIFVVQLPFITLMLPGTKARIQLGRRCQGELSAYFLAVETLAK